MTSGREQRRERRRCNRPANDDPTRRSHATDATIGRCETFPTSNVATGAYASLADHPFPRLRDTGVVVTLNSDDPAMFGSWVSDEYRVARDAFGYDDADLADIAAAGVRASFADDDDKQQMLRDIEAWLTDG